MRLRLGQAVYATDGLFGELGDIVIEPEARTVTHLIVQPHRRHYQARLVPIWLAKVEGDTIKVGLDTPRIRQLQRVNFAEYVRYGHPIDLDDEWDVGITDVVYMPHMDPDFDEDIIDHQVEVAFDRIPKDECEIRRASEVVTSDQLAVGSVDGFLTDGDQLVAVVVRARGKRPVAVPLRAVARVLNDRIELAIDQASFEDLPASDPRSDEDTTSRLLGALRRRIELWATWTADAARRARDQAKG